MKYRKLGKSNIEVSEISLGCWTMGGLNWVNGDPNGWANVDEKEVAEAINYAIDHGVNHFDNADVYGNGRGRTQRHDRQPRKGDGESWRKIHRVGRLYIRENAGIGAATPHTAGIADIGIP